MPNTEQYRYSNRGYIVLNEFNDPDFNVEKAVDSLFFNQLAKPHLHGSLKFQKELITVALKAFGTTNFYSWYMKQKNGQYFSELHHEFLLDTLSYLSGDLRKYPLSTWDSLISKDEIEPGGTLEAEVIEQSFFGITTSGHVRKPIQVSTPDLLKTWFASDMGAQDLVHSLHILFGKPYEREALYS